VIEQVAQKRVENAIASAEQSLGMNPLGLPCVSSKPNMNAIAAIEQSAQGSNRSRQASKADASLQRESGPTRDRRQFG
jgi:hypothetical protein